MPAGVMDAVLLSALTDLLMALGAFIVGLLLAEFGLTTRNDGDLHLATRDVEDRLRRFPLRKRMIIAPAFLPWALPTMVEPGGTP